MVAAPDLSFAHLRAKLAYVETARPKSATCRRRVQAAREEALVRFDSCSGRLRREGAACLLAAHRAEQDSVDRVDALAPRERDGQALPTGFRRRRRTRPPA